MSFPRFLGFVVLTGILGVLAKFGGATVIYDNGSPLSATDQTNVTGWEMTHYIQANNFYLANPSRLDGFVFWDLEEPGYFAGSIVWQIYSDNGNGTPGPLLFSSTSRNLTHTATGFTPFATFHENITGFDLGPLSLPTGTYWIALHNGDLSNGTTGTVLDWNFYWEATRVVTAALPLKKIAPYNGAWLSLTNPKNAAFQISGVTAPAAAVIAIDANTAQIAFASTAGFNYRVEFRDALTNSTWTTLPGGDNLVGDGSVIELTDAGRGTQSRRFYRISLPYNGAGIPVISDFSLGKGSPQVSFTTAAGYFYRIEYKNELTDLFWAPVSGAETIVGNGGIMQVSDTDPSLGGHPRRVYRATLQ